jgi:hypothetical protein
MSEYIQTSNQQAHTQDLAATLTQLLGDVVNVTVALGEVTVTVGAANLARCPCMPV